ncbi:DUF3164 family protein [Dysgonomonas sp. 520]|uniref:DUF3164 family protein n=1 Tax=Dysgonomonas sp. 520 TaxID=2302931 RepID=UPI0013CFD9D3|nr:DUF3164 family protein [Dysgonomonas sp. 520]NDW10478.1 DUF3164 family protein [Dysgonomonas sp. 520]
MTEKTIDQLSTEELEALLAKKKKEETDRKKKEREVYEQKVNSMVMTIVANAIRLHKDMRLFHSETTDRLVEMRNLLNQYGEIKSTSKGGFQRVTDDGKSKIVYKYSTICDWDERAEKAESLLRDFLKDFVKKRDIKMYNIISALLERNKEGNLEYSRIQSLYSHENEFDDPRWKEAIRLFKESFRAVDSKMRIEVYKRSDQSQKWELISLNLSSF